MNVARLLIVVVALGSALGCGSRTGLRKGGAVVDGSASDGGPGSVSDAGASDGLRPDAGNIVTLTGIGVTPPLGSTGIGLRTTFTATGRFSDGSTRDLTAQATWSADPPAVASVNGGVATGLGAGTATIRATAMNQSGTAQLTVTAAKLTSLSVDPPTANLPVNAPFPLRATGVFSDGSKQDLTAQVTWTSSDSGIVAVVGGVLTGAKAGTVTIIATAQGISASATITVTDASLISIEVSPASPILPLPGNQQFTATAVYANGSKGDITAAVEWQSSDPTVLAIMVQGGAAAATGVGTATVTAHLGAITGMATVSVRKATLTSLTVAPMVANLVPGTSAAFTATATFDDATSSDVTASVAWSSSDENVATISSAPGSQGVATALHAGAAKILATLAGFTGGAVVNVTGARQTGLTINPPGGTLAVAAVLVLHATATFSDGSTVDVTGQATWKADSPIVTVSNGGASAGQVTALQQGATAVNATFGGFSAAAKVSVSGATLLGIVVTPNPLTVMMGARQDLRAQGKYSDGTMVDITAQVTWTSDSGRVATVSNVNSGTVTGVTAGTTTVHARLSGQDGAAMVTVTGPTAIQLSLAPLLATRRVGQNVAFTASVVLSNNTARNVTNQSDWSSSDPRVATIDSMGGGRGGASCVGPGTATITATYMGVTASTTLTCNVAMPIALEVSPVLTTLQVGQRQQLTAAVVYSDGSSVNVTGNATWTSSAPLVASVANQMMNRGEVTGLAAGTATIVAMYMGMSGSAQVTVTAGTLMRVSLAPVTASLRVGQGRAFTLSGVYSDGSTRNVTGMAVWLSSDGSIAAVSNMGGNRGQVTALAAGVATITATFMGMSDSATVTVTAPRAVSVTLTPDGGQGLVGQTVQLTATALFDDMTSADVTGAAVFATSNPMIADVVVAGPNRGQVSGLAAGTVTLTVTYLGLMDTTMFTVGVAAAMVVQVTPAGPTVALGASQQFQATAQFSDGTTHDVTDQVVWTSSAPMIAAASNADGTRGLVTALGAGGADVTATLGTASGVSHLTVLPVVQLLITPVTAALPAGITRALQVQALLADMTMVDVTAFAMWSSSDPMVATVSDEGLVSTLAPGPSTIGAALGGVAAMTGLTVGTQTLTAITVTPGMTMLAEDATMNLVAQGTYSDGSSYPLTDQAMWVSTAPGVVTVSNAAGSQGLVTGIAAGNGTVEAHFGGMTGSAAIVVP